jgi:hypothetical protein
MSNPSNLHKVILSVPTESSLLKLCDSLNAQNIEFVQWNERPENIFTAIATLPCTKAQVGDIFKNHCQLLR